MKKNIMKSILILSSLCGTGQAYASDVTVEQIGNFLCSVDLCKNGAVISNIETSGINMPNLAEKLTCADQKYFGKGCESAKQVLTLSFRQVSATREYVREFRSCNLIVSSPEVMQLSDCRISGKGKSSILPQLSLGEAELMHQQETGVLTTILKTK